jgi:hypothetical protein
MIATMLDSLTTCSLYHCVFVIHKEIFNDLLNLVICEYSFID